MKILAKIDKTSGKYALIQLADEVIHGRINSLIRKGKYPQAILEAISRAESLREVYEAEKERIKAQLIITEKSAHWDLTV